VDRPVAIDNQPRYKNNDGHEAHRIPASAMSYSTARRLACCPCRSPPIVAATNSKPVPPEQITPAANPNANAAPNTLPSACRVDGVTRSQSNPQIGRDPVVSVEQPPNRQLSPEFHEGPPCHHVAREPIPNAPVVRHHDGPDFGACARLPCEPGAACTHGPSADSDSPPVQLRRPGSKSRLRTPSNAFMDTEYARARMKSR
jgi:hypothetical protein